MFDLTGQIVMITGAAGNLGAAVARGFQRAGARVSLLDRGAGRLAAMFTTSPDSLLLEGVEMNDATAVEQAVVATRDRFGRIDALINTVGGYRGGTPLHQLPLEEADALMSLNARTVFVACRAVVPYLLRQGSGKIINVASRAALKGEAGASIYSASKSAVVSLTESLAAEVKDAGLNVNCVLPGLLDTPPNRAAMPDADYSRWVAPEAVADVILFLASDAARAVHGAAIPVYGRS